jgi:TRAP-type C4-dicarboxylate transport system permease large subunit
VRTTAMVLLVIGCAAAFGWLLAYLRVPRLDVAFMQGVSDNPIIVLLLINVMLLLPRHLHGHVAAHRHHHADLPAGGRPSASIRCISA